MASLAALPRAFGLGVAAALCALWLGVPAVYAAGVDDAKALFKAGERDQALRQVNKVLESNPKDPKARFLKGVILAESGDAKAAADVFQRLTQDYPALPEPYNNLAVIYASEGHYDEARVALEKSIRTHPSYATAYDNLGDVYSKLASEAYDRALRLNASDAGASKKLMLVRELREPAQAAPLRLADASSATAAKPTPPAAAKSSPSVAPAQGVAVTPAQRAKTVASAPITVVPAPAASASPPKAVAAAAGSQPQADSPAASAGAKAASARAEEAKPTIAAAKPPAAPSAKSDPETDILRSVRAWAQAWSKQDVDAYLSFYAAEFKTPHGESRADWEQQRRARVGGPSKIKVALRDIKVVRHDERHVAVTFQQAYRSDRFQGRTRKTLEMVRVGDDWRILEEVVSK
jgi:hypothetical protein